MATAHLRANTAPNLEPQSPAFPAIQTGLHLSLAPLPTERETRLDRTKSPRRAVHNCALTLPRPFPRPGPDDGPSSSGAPSEGCFQGSEWLAGWGGEPSPQKERLGGLAPTCCSEPTLGAPAGRRPKATRLSRPLSTKLAPAPLPRAVLCLPSASQASGDQVPPLCCLEAERNLFTKPCFYRFLLLGRCLPLTGTAMASPTPGESAPSSPGRSQFLLFSALHRSL